MVNVYSSRIGYSEPQITAAIRSPEPSRPNLVNMAVIMALSLLLHGMLVAWCWNRMLSAARSAHNTQHALEVQLLRLWQPPSTTVPYQPTETKVRQLAGHTPKPNTKQVVAPGSTTLSTTGPTDLSPPAPEKHIDLEAIHSSVGAIATQIDREKRNTPVGQLQAKPLYAPELETKLGRNIASTARPDCKEKIAHTGLLAPLAILAMTMDGKDSGCKW